MKVRITRKRFQKGIDKRNIANDKTITRKMGGTLYREYTYNNK